MSENLTMRLLWAVLVGGAFGWVAAYGNAQMKKPGTQLGSRPRYGSMAYGIILPIAVLAYAVIELLSLGAIWNWRSRRRFPFALGFSCISVSISFC